MKIPSLFLQAHPTSVQMGHNKNLGFITKSWFPWILKVGFMVLALFGRVTSQDKIEAPPTSSGNLLCISECGTCPTICSPPPPSLVTPYSNHPPPPLLTSYPNQPPPPLLTSYPPPSSPKEVPVPHSPSQYFFTYPPPPPPHKSLLPPPALLLPPPSSPPPPTPASHSSGAAPPPPPFKSYNSPSSGSAQPNVIAGPHEYPYPYYYYYASSTSTLSIDHVIPFFLLLLFLHHHVFFCW